MFSKVARPISNVFTRKRADSGVGLEDSSENHTAHVHGMWFQPSPLPRVTSRDRSFRNKLVAAYIETTRAARDFPRNVKAHFWTDRANEYPLYMPSETPGGFDLELPHSMLAMSNLSLHMAGDIEERIDQVKDDEQRATFKKLYYHPATINIGLRSDLVRLLYGILYCESTPESVSRGKTEFNMHVDIDTAKETVSAKTGEKKTVGRTPENGHKKAMLEWTAVQASLGRLNFPEKPAPLTKEELARLVAQPQKSWSQRVPVKREQGASVVIPDKLLKKGYGTIDRENDVIGMVPGHENAFAVAKKTAIELDTKYKGKKFYKLQTNYDTFSKHMGHYGSYLHLLSTGEDPGKSEGLSQQNLTDYFRLAEKIRQLKPVLQEEITGLEAIYHNSDDERYKNLVKMKIKAINNIYQLSADFISTFVNANSYSPQIANSPKKDAEFDKLFKSIFGGERVREGSTGSWKAGSLEVSIKLDSEDVPLNAAQVVFKEIKKRIKPVSTDDLGW